MHFKELEKILADEGIVFLSYGGSMTQPLISGMTDALEKEVESNETTLKGSNNIFIIFIELSQNMMNYFNTHPQIREAGLIIVGMTADKSGYYVLGRNTIDDSTKSVIEERLAAIEGLGKDALRQLYREKRKAGKRGGGHGAGIGFIEVARRCDKIAHNFYSLGNGKYYFTVKAFIYKSEE